MLAICRPGDKEAAQGEDARNEGGVGNTARRREVAAHDGRGFWNVSMSGPAVVSKQARVKVAGDGTQSGVVCLEGGGGVGCRRSRFKVGRRCTWRLARGDDGTKAVSTEVD